MPVIRLSVEADFPVILAIVNDAARAYRNWSIPARQIQTSVVLADERWVEES